MKAITTICFIVALAETAMGGWLTKDPVDEIRVKTAHELLGEKYFIKSDTSYNDEKENMKIHIRKIKDSYKEYTSAMWEYKVWEKILCVSDRVVWQFLTVKSELSVHVLVYMIVKGIKDEGQLGIEIDTGDEKLIVPLSKVVLPPSPTLFEKIAAIITCSTYHMPTHDLIFYLLEYKNDRWAPGLNDVNIKVTQEDPPQREDSQDTN